MYTHIYIYIYYIYIYIYVCSYILYIITVTKSCNFNRVVYDLKFHAVMQSSGTMSILRS